MDTIHQLFLFDVLISARKDGGIPFGNEVVLRSEEVVMWFGRTSNQMFRSEKWQVLDRKVPGGNKYGFVVKNKIKKYPDH